MDKGPPLQDIRTLKSSTPFLFIRKLLHDSPPHRKLGFGICLIPSPLLPNRLHLREIHIRIRLPRAANPQLQNDIQSRASKARNIVTQKSTRRPVPGKEDGESREEDDEKAHDPSRDGAIRLAP